MLGVAVSRPLNRTWLNNRLAEAKLRRKAGKVTPLLSVTKTLHLLDMNSEFGFEGLAGVAVSGHFSGSKWQAAFVLGSGSRESAMGRLPRQQPRLALPQVGVGSGPFHNSSMQCRNWTCGAFADPISPCLREKM